MAWLAGSVAEPQRMLNIAIFDPWQRSLFSRQRTPGKEPLLAGKGCFCVTCFFTGFSQVLIQIIVIYICVLHGKICI